MSSTTPAASNHPSDDEPPTPQPQTSAIPQVTRWLENLNLNDMAPGSTTGSVGGDGHHRNGLKIGAPIEFTGGRNQVETFILQCQLVFNVNAEKWTSQNKRMLYIISYMKGAAFEFIQPHLKDYLEHPEVVTDRKTSTRRILTRDVTLFEELRTTFGYGNEQQDAERALQALRQKGSAAKYKAEFQIQAAKLEWNDEALAAQFYLGLKENVKDEMARDDRPDTFHEMWETAIKIDTRIYDRQLERKGTFRPGPIGAKWKAQRDVPEWRDNYYGLQKMQLDATRGKPGPRGNRQGQPGSPRRNQPKSSHDKTNLTCYNCGQKGHYARDCRSRKQRHELQPTTPRGTIAATTQDSHASLSWTACYEDSCPIHRSDKDGSGWWPKEPRAQKMCMLRAQLPEPSEVSEAEEDDDSSEDCVSSNDDEQGSSIDPDGSDLMEFVIQGEGEALRMIREIATRYEEVFPRIGNQRHLHPHEFERMLERLRAMFWRHRLVDVEYDHAMIIHEYPPLGSVFSGDGGYTTPDGIVVNPCMRRTVRKLKQHYRTRQELLALRRQIRHGRPNHEVIERAERLEQQAEETRLLTYEDWDRLRGGTIRPPLRSEQAGNE